MGAGKSTIGKLLAQRMGWEFYDSDHVIEARTGADIPWIFDVEGEEGFRERETAVLEELISLKGAIIATGGGIVLRERNRELLTQAREVVYLTASIDQLVERTCKDKKRPLLQVADPRAKIIELFEQRDPLYKEVADKVLVTDGRPPKYVVQTLVEYLESIAA